MPESTHNATEASRHVGAVELTPRPTLVANVIMIENTAHVVNAPATIGVHCSVHALAGLSANASTSSVSMLIARVLTKAKQRENGHDDYDQANEIYPDSLRRRKIACVTMAGGFCSMHDSGRVSFAKGSS